MRTEVEGQSPCGGQGGGRWEEEASGPNFWGPGKERGWMGPWHQPDMQPLGLHD